MKLRAKAARPGPAAAAAVSRRPADEVGTHPPARLGAGPQPGSTSRAGWRGRQLAPQSAVRPATSAAPRAGRGPLRGLSGAPPAHLSAPLRPSEGPGPGAGTGRPLRKASVTWGVAGGWAAFRTGGGRQDEEAECGRGGRAAGIRRPRPGRKASWPEVADAPAAGAVVAVAAPAAPSGSSSGWSKMAALPAQGFLSPSQWAGPQKKGGGCARSQRSPEEGGGARPGGHAPSSARPSGVGPSRLRPAPLALTPEGGGESGLRKRSRVPSPPREVTAQVRMLLSKGCLGPEMSGLETLTVINIVSASHWATSVYWLPGHTRISCIYSTFTNQFETCENKAGQHPKKLLVLSEAKRWLTLTNPLVLIRRWPSLPCV